MKEKSKNAEISCPFQCANLFLKKARVLKIDRVFAKIIIKHDGKLYF
jgi:hemin uptake protein HemP